MEEQNYKVDFFVGILLVVGLFIGQSVAYAIGLGLSSLLGKDVTDTGIFNIFMYMATMVVPILFFDFFIVRKDGRKLNFDFSTKPFRVYLLIFPMMFGMMLVADYTTQLIPTTGDLLGEIYKMYSEQFEKLAEDPVSLLIMTVILAPILEEILFRGIIMKGMVNNNVKPVTAIVISAFIFGLVHFNPWQFAGAFLLGLVLGLVYYKTKSLLMSILLHAFNNLVSAMMMLYSDSETFSDLTHLNKELVLVMGIVIFAVPFYFFAIHKNIIYKD
ncbi:CPBP family intramembrane glutamic endopeptidase [Epilithonimonas caeni]|uniref:CPBP family intramembrane glutamic endopeptidase n=1 Tax=Epilithonimonas caeni TaxID=365343 RepID=UPI0003F852F5|nr:type II CAAX endopeptidase family protein [Epilithonimonas caeni]